MNKFYTIKIDKNFDKELRKLESSLSFDERITSTCVVDNNYVVTTEKTNRDPGERNLLLEEIKK